MTKPVSLSNEAYLELSKLKEKNTSFSDIILSLIKQKKEKKDIRRFAGSLKEYKTELEKFKNQIEKDRKNNCGRKI